jgi:hypothetical protein
MGKTKLPCLYKVAVLAPAVKGVKEPVGARGWWLGANWREFLGETIDLLATSRAAL